MRPHDELAVRIVIIKMIIMHLSPKCMPKLMGKYVTIEAPVITMLDCEDNDTAMPMLLADTVLLGQACLGIINEEAPIDKEDPAFKKICLLFKGSFRYDIIT
jgi:hypothetical protein